MVSPPEAEYSAALGIREEGKSQALTGRELMLVLNWERNGLCGPLPRVTEQRLDNPTDTI